MTIAFDFGKNWLNFSRSALTADKAQQSRQDFRRLLDQVELKDKSFLDIGFGQGLALFAAAEAGATVHGCDINPTCAEALAVTGRFFPEIPAESLGLTIGSILADQTIDKLRAASGTDGFDVVHSWGALHHTGDMETAIRNAASLVKPGGHFVLAIYNRHITSPVWRVIKWLYCKSPAWLQRAAIALFYPIIWLAKLAVTRQLPTKLSRGMEFYIDVVDWVGGYPYEYASIDEIERLAGDLGFSRIKVVPAQVPTGCNEFVFRRN